MWDPNQSHPCLKVARFSSRVRVQGLGSGPKLLCAQVAAEVIGAVGEEHAQWLDDGSEHPHRIALMVAAARVPDVTARLAQGFAQRGVQVRVLFQGFGSVC